MPSSAPPKTHANTSKLTVTGFMIKFVPSRDQPSFGCTPLTRKFELPCQPRIHSYGAGSRGSSHAVVAIIVGFPLRRAG